MARTQTTRGSQAAGFAAGRGLLIVLFAAAIGVLLLAKAVDSDTDDAAIAPDAGLGSATTLAGTGGDPTASTPAPSTPTTVTPTIPEKKEPQTVVVLVANGRGVAGAAKANADALSVQNYNMLVPSDYPSAAEATKVYFLPDYQADAIAIAQALTIDASAVAPMPAEGLPVDVKNAAVVVVLGTDGQGLAPS